MRQVVLDTETTGLDVGDGHRIIEIGCVELVHRRITGARFHHYLNPDRDIDAGAIEVHGITKEFLSDKPEFSAIAASFLDFVRGAELIIHNAPFDIGFIDSELALLGPQWGSIETYCPIIDTLAVTRQIHPGQKNTLDALCKRYDIDNSQRELHGALLDAQILAEVYLAMTGGQASLHLETEAPQARAAANTDRLSRELAAKLRVLLATPQERADHQCYLDMISAQSGGKCAWEQMAGGSDSAGS